MEDDSDSSSDDDKNNKSGQLTGRAKWVIRNDPSDSDSDSDNDTPKIVQSAKDKRFDEMRITVGKLKTASKIKDWLSLLKEFDNLQKAFVKNDALIQREGTPRFYIRTLVFIEDTLNAGMDTKKMNGSTAKAFNTIKQKFKKEFKLREKELSDFRAKPVDEEESADEAEKSKYVKTEKRSARVVIATPPDDGDADDDGFIEVGKGGKAVEVNASNFFEKFNQVLEARGKKNTDKFSQIETLVLLKKAAKTVFQKISVLNLLIPTRFDFIPPVSGCMLTEMWKFALEEIKSLYDLLEANSNVTIGAEEDDEETLQSKDKKVSAGVDVQIRGNIYSFVDRLDDEFFKSLQNIDPHTTEYIDRLIDETSLYALLVRAQKFAESQNASRDTLDLMLMRRVEHLYYKPDQLIQKIEDAVRIEYPQLVESLSTSETLVPDFCTTLYKTTMDNVRIRALLCHVYHLALHNQFHEAHNMMLMSHLQESIQQNEVSTQTLYNRTMVQIGLCAFRCGLFKEAHTTLQDIASTGKTKELLAQGISSNQKFVEKTLEQDKLDKYRQLPFHMHVNLELLECAYLVSAMFLEIPNMALYPYDSRRRVISKSFRRMLEYNERQVFIGPPENTRDHIMAAAKSMANGNWKDCMNYIFTVKVWELLPNVDQVKEMLKASIQEESLRTYIFSFASHYDSFSIETLSSMFELSHDKIKSIISKMIYKKQIEGIITSDDTIKMYQSVPNSVNITKLEHLANHYSDKLSLLVDGNEKLLEVKLQHDGKHVHRKKDNRFKGN
ncbi:eukaryotic translation initiation factor 3 subunit 8 N-terminus-domain-containing protein [Globomyces pollinis-pini]|nr:eukaryotic translation initiation factor 3 subunit 8 N-terminus-domain-containing protein [Globomyces pollinis-pini]